MKEKKSKKEKKSRCEARGRPNTEHSGLLS